MINWPAPPSGMGNEANWFRKLLSACRQTEILPGVGYRVKETSNGRILDILKQTTPPFTQVPGMFPFRIYKPNPLPPDGTAVTTFDSNGAQVAAVVSRLVATDFTASTPTINPNTDAWRFWNVRTGLVEVRPYFSVAPDLWYSNWTNYSEVLDVWLGTDDVEPTGEPSMAFDDPTTVAQSGGTTLIIPGTPASGEGIEFSLWIQIVPDVDEYDVPTISIMGKTFFANGIYSDPFPDNSPFVIPIGFIFTTFYGIIPIADVTDLTVSQLTFNHIVNRWAIGMFGDGGIGALSYRGDWDVDDIQDMVFYPGDVIRKYVTVNAGGNATYYFPARNLYMSNAVCFTDDPTTDGNFTWIAGAVSP